MTLTPDSGHPDFENALDVIASEHGITVARADQGWTLTSQATSKCGRAFYGSRKGLYGLRIATGHWNYEVKLGRQPDYVSHLTVAMPALAHLLGMACRP
jgi:hypothetical protein